MIPVHFLAAAEAAHRAGGQHLQVIPAPSNARDHPSIIPNHHTHAVHAPVYPACSPDAHLTACDSTLRMAVWMAAVGAAILLEINNLANQA